MPTSKRQPNELEKDIFDYLQGVPNWDDVTTGQVKRISVDARIAHDFGITMERAHNIICLWERNYNIAGNYELIEE